MMADPYVYLLVLVAGAFIAAFVIGAVGFADALILNAIWLHFMDPVTAIPLVVSCGLIMHLVPVFKLRKVLDFSRLPPFIVGGILGVPLGAWTLAYVDPELFRAAIAIFLILYGVWMLLRPATTIGDAGGRSADGIIGLSGGFLGGFAGLSGVLPTLWAGIRNWPKNMQRGVYQPFVLVMHGLGVITFAANGMITQRTGQDLLWCLPAIIIGSWLGLKVYPYLNDQHFKRIVLGLILLSGITLLF